MEKLTDGELRQAHSKLVVISVVICFQNPFNEISFSMIGDDSGPSYFQLLDNGDIKLRGGVNLPSDSQTQYNVRILPIDGDVS